MGGDAVKLGVWLLCDELGGAKYGLTLGKYRAWPGSVARLAGRVAYVHHGRLFTLVRLAAESGAWICADMFWSRLERDLAGSLRACRPRLGLVQLADAVPTSLSMPDRVVPGDGVVPLGWLIGQLAAVGIRGFFDVELLGPRITAEGAWQAMTRGVRHVRALLQASYPNAPASGTDNCGTAGRGEPR